MPPPPPSLCSGSFRWFSPPPLTPTAHVLNVCAALALAAERGVGGQAYFVTDGPAVDFREFVTQYVQACAVRVVCALAGVGERLAGRAALRWGREGSVQRPGG